MMRMRAAEKMAALALCVTMAGMYGCASQKNSAGTQTQSSAINTAQSATAPATQPAAFYGAVVQRDIQEPTRRVVHLANGLTVILQQNKTAPVVAARVYVKAGSLTEQEYMGTGISHVLEHLVAGATTKNMQEALSQQILRSIGNDSNAYTTYDQTCYFITTTAEKWPQALKLLSAWTTGADFTPEEFAREYQVVQREIEMGESDPRRTFYKLTNANRYTIHPARHPVIGYKPAFQKLTWEDCRTYYQRMYVPDNMVVSIAGDIDLDGAEKLVSEAFGSAERRKVPAISLPEEPAVLAPRTVVSHADIRIAQVEWAFPTVSLYHPDQYPLDVLATILGDGESSILVSKLRDELGIVQAISASDHTPAYAQGEFAVFAVTVPGKIAAVEQAVMTEIKNIADNGVDPALVQKAKTQMASMLIYGNQTAEQQASRNASDYLNTSTIDYSKKYVEEIKKVTPQQVRDVARRYIHPDVMLTTMLLPKNVRDAAVTKSSGKQQADMIAQETRRSVLPNGMTVLVKRNPASPIVSMNLYVKGGLLAENAGTNGTGNTMMQLLDRGTQTRSAQDIAEFFDSTAGDISTLSGNNTFGVNVTCLKENAEKTFDVFSDIVLHPAFKPEELDRLRPRLLQAIDRAREDWFSEGMIFLRQNYFADSPYSRSTIGTREVVANLSAEDLRKHYQSEFLRPERAVLAIYGDIDPAQAEKWAQTFAAMPKGNGDLKLSSTRKPAGKYEQHSGKPSAGIMIGFGPGMTITNPDRDAITIMQTMLSGYNSPGGSILHETLRGKGLVYVVHSMNITGPAEGFYVVAAQGEPKNKDEIIRIILEKIDEIKAGKFKDEELTLAKDQALTGEQLRDQTISAQALSETLDELLGLGYNDRAAESLRLKSVSRADIIRVANQYLRDPVITMTTPEAKKDVK